MTRLEILELFKNENGTYNQRGALEAMKRFGKLAFDTGVDIEYFRKYYEKKRNYNI